MPRPAVLLLARPPGLAVLDWILEQRPVAPICVATHRRLPKAEDAARAERPHYALYEERCARAGIRLVAADDKVSAGELRFLDDLPPFDLLCCVSWRYLLAPSALARPRLGAVNLHRGLLPGYEGAEPVKRMIADGLKEAVITAHVMVAELDAGPVLATVRLPMDWDGTTSPAEHAEVVKTRLVPLYGPLMGAAIAAIEAR